MNSLEVVIMTLIALNAKQNNQTMTAEKAVVCAEAISKASYATTFTGEYPIKYIELGDRKLVSFQDGLYQYDILEKEDHFYLGLFDGQVRNTIAISYATSEGQEYITYYPHSSRPYTVASSEVQYHQDSYEFNSPFGSGNSVIKVNKADSISKRLNPFSRLGILSAKSFKASLKTYISILRNDADFARMIGENVDEEKISQIEANCL